MIKKVVGVSFKSKPFCVWYWKENDILCYDGEAEETLTNDELRLKKRDFTAIRLQPRDIEKGLIESYKYYVKMAQDLRKASQGLINMNKTGTPSQTAVHVWNIMKKKEGKVEVVEPISKDEEKLLINCKIGAIIFGSEYQGSGYSYDFKSFYPSIMSNVHFLIPIKQGEWKTIQTFKDVERFNNLPYGYYRCIVSKSGDKKTDRFFRFNKQNIYTHFDISSANKLKLKVELITDDKPNCYIYTRDKMLTGSQLFSKFVNRMFMMKEAGIEGAKLILNSLWGSLCKGSHKVVTLDPEDEQPDGNIIDIKQNSDGTVSYFFYKDKPFTYDFARMKPFLLAKARSVYVDVVYPFSDKVVRCHTDSIISTEKLEFKQQSSKYKSVMGELSFEGYYEHFDRLKKNRSEKVKPEKTKEQIDKEELEQLAKEFDTLIREGKL